MIEPLKKTLVGQLQWASKQARPDTTFAACELSIHLKKATTNDVKEASKHLRKLQSESGIICIPDLKDITQTNPNPLLRCMACKSE